MFLILQKHLSQVQLENLCNILQGQNLTFEYSANSSYGHISLGSEAETLPEHFFMQVPGVEKIIRTGYRCPLAIGKASSHIEIAIAIAKSKVTLSPSTKPVIIAGPCSVESEEHIINLAQKIQEAGASLLRGGAFKPRTSPYDFQGLGITALKYLHLASIETGMPVVSEVMSAKQLEMAIDYIDVFQVGARNMYNYELLKELGKVNKPVLLKRSFSATIEEFLQSAEYLISCGNAQIILCERGIRTFETQTRNTLDLNAVALLRTVVNMPIFVDPSHGTGNSKLVQPMSQAAIACGASGLIIEVHEKPSESISDAAQAIDVNTLKDIIKKSFAIWATLNIKESIFDVNQVLTHTNSTVVV